MKKPKRKNRVPLSPAIQLLNVIEAVFDESIEYETAQDGEFDVQLLASAENIDLGEFARQYATRLVNTPDKQGPEIVMTNSKQRQISGKEMERKAMRHRPAAQY